MRGSPHIRIGWTCCMNKCKNWRMPAVYVLGGAPHAQFLTLLCPIGERGFWLLDDASGSNITLPLSCCCACLKWTGQETRDPGSWTSLSLHVVHKSCLCCLLMNVRSTRTYSHVTLAFVTTWTARAWGCSSLSLICGVLLGLLLWSHQLRLISNSM